MGKRERSVQNIISCRPSSYGKYRSKAYGHLSKIGVKHVELPMPSLEDIEGTLADLGGHGLSIASVQAPCNLSSKNLAEEFRIPVKTAKRMGAKRIFVSVKTGGMMKETVYQRLRAVGDVAAEENLIVILETHPDLATNGDLALETMEAVDHPNIRINFDTANIYYYNREVDGIEEMKKILDYIDGVHLKDTNGKFQAWHFPTLGKGIVNFLKVRRLLNNRGFYGPFTIENEGIKGENLTLEQTFRRMEESVNHLRECGF